MIRPSTLLVTVGSVLAGFVAKTWIDNSMARAQADKRSPDTIAEAEIKNVLRLRDVLGRLNKTVAALCHFKLEALVHDEAGRLDLVPSRYGYEVLEYVTVARDVSARLLNPTTRSMVNRMLANVHRIELISTPSQAEELAADIAHYWSELDPMLAADLREAAGPEDEFPDTSMQSTATSAS